MPKFGPVSRRDLIKNLRLLGFTGPESGAKHQFMTRGDTYLIIPNPHKGDIAVNLLNRLLKQANISKKDWENLS
jgi:predicted RNA binding protein YcfA (HicA-like mRNA interferase family)